MLPARRGHICRASRALRNKPVFPISIGPTPAILRWCWSASSLPFGQSPMAHWLPGLAGTAGASSLTSAVTTGSTLIGLAGFALVTFVICRGSPWPPIFFARRCCRGGLWCLRHVCHRFRGSRFGCRRRQLWLQRRPQGFCLGWRAVGPRRALRPDRIGFVRLGRGRHAELLNRRLRLHRRHRHACGPIVARDLRLNLSNDGRSFLRRSRHVEGCCPVLSATATGDGSGGLLRTAACWSGKSAPLVAFADNSVDPLSALIAAISVELEPGLLRPKLTAMPATPARTIAAMAKSGRRDLI